MAPPGLTLQQPGYRSSSPVMKNLSSLIGKLRHWFAEGLAHSFGEPEQEHRLEPPHIGVQPFHGDPPRRARA
ncbi:MAG: hypothetical protein F4Z75_06195 [Synechococcus sp. SB0668_bin_15]|nr:hypothetical protein [Synechococcus sp. SB0668_bin_15]MXZ83963.1 hypothetical protein [Synechococcus sp. SB0666_bin_14]MYA90948.1 hypothetical protein [Synechococcus sp. SB0663_bin_10]MYC50345.1 hypothetical protein [Synechococcus sp. SB0662_bin_14]MYG46484.1 hypothetical protein [Synechococcus sp. SB0675_bin_6]MYJ59470.1 hypothetical protein [Synechococcus sp. SB0672_bin_6]MYK90735.1 hypothetical protein [Synechococcus sp. SB0669_bin_8]